MGMLDGKIAVITGGGTGIGRAHALLFAAQGAKLLINDTGGALDGSGTSDTAEAVAEEVRAAGGVAVANTVSVASFEGANAIINAAVEQYGRIDILVNNAGVVDKTARVQDMTEARLLRMFTTNTISAFLCCREAVKRMSTALGKGGGAIINVSSAASRLGSANQYVDYAASKGAMDVLTHGLAQEVAAQGIRVNAVRPGLIDTDIHASGGLPNRVNDLAASVPMGRGGSAEEVAQAIVWLASEQASYTTMSMVEVSGGR